MIDRLFTYLRKKIYKHVLLKEKEILPNTDIVVDVIIPVIPKDLLILPLCIAGVRENVNHVLGDIYVVAPVNTDIQNFCKKNDLIFVDERSVLGYATKEICFVTKDGCDRSGWIFQQLLKLSGTIGNHRYYLVMDSDHILLRPHTFITSTNKLCFYQSREWHYPYYKNIKGLIGKNAIHRLSYVAHKMIFDKNLLFALHDEIERRNNCSWDQAIIRSLDKSQSSPFSEYELFGTYVSKRDKVSLPWREKAVKYNMINSFDVLKKQFSDCLSITFPAYLND